MEHLPYKLKKKGKFWHYTIHINGQRKRGSTKSTSRDLAVRYANKAFNDLYQRGHALSTPKISLRDMVGKHMERCGMKNLAPEWLYTKELTLNNFIDFVRNRGISRVNQLKPEDFEDYMGLQLKKNKPVTVKNIMKVIKALMNDACRLGYIQKNPMDDLPRIDGIKKNRKRFLSKIEIGVVLDAVNGMYLENFVLTAIYTGLRRRELIHLEFGDVDFHKKLLYVRNKEGFQTKSRRERVLPLHKKLWPFFKEKNSGLCFPYEGRIANEDTATRNFKTMIGRAGVEDVGLHTLRHTFVSHCLMSGVSIWEVSKWAGHASSYVTELYGHLCPDRREIDRLDI